MHGFLRKIILTHEIPPLTTKIFRNLNLFFVLNFFPYVNKVEGLTDRL